MKVISRLFFPALLVACSTPQNTNYEASLACVSEGWNSGNAKAASDCFTEDATYQDMMSDSTLKGRESLFEFFGGTEGRKNKMTMIWHDQTFDQVSNTGFAEFSFHYGTWSHGVIRYELRDGKVSHWREYWLESPQAWDELPIIKEDTVQ